MYNHMYLTYNDYIHVNTSTYIIFNAVLLIYQQVVLSEKYNRIYWCVAYLPSEASIIEHWTYTFHYRLSYTFIKQCETLKLS
jgi:hypothetical protein